MRPSTRPVIIQGGMGVAVSSWRLASAVACAGALGVVSATALDVVLARRLQDGDPGGHLRRAMAAFPFPDMAGRVLSRYFRPAGRLAGRGYRPVPPLTVSPTRRAQELVVLGNFVEVFLAKEGHGGAVGINFLEKAQLPTAFASYGAMLAGVDYVLVGAGLPRDIPRLLSALSRGEPASLPVEVAGSTTQHRIDLHPATWSGIEVAPPARPDFLAIVASDTLAAYLARDEGTRPEGFVVEGPTAGGHNAPPRGRLTLDKTGEPVYGPRDLASSERMASLGLPFWLAGSYGTPERLEQALADGATGIQVGTVFALCEESGLSAALRRQALDVVRDGTLRVHTDVEASPTGFPFKVVDLGGAEATPRTRLCDIGVLRTPYQRPDASVGYRCAAEPVEVFVAKGGSQAATSGAVCLCNGLTANVCLGQTRPDGFVEPPVLTLGSDLSGARRLLQAHPHGWTAAQTVSWLRG